MNVAAFKALLDGDMENAVVAMTPGWIEAQEARGQQALVMSEILPKSGVWNSTEVWEQLEQLGIVRLGDYDDLFYKVQLPTGWSKRATGHSMWSDLLDDKGRKRAAIFYKAAFYDRSAHITLERRYSYRVRPDGGYTGDYNADMLKPYRGYVTDQNVPIWQTDGTVSRPADESDRSLAREFFDKKDVLETQAKMWLVEHCPDWNNPLAYWD